MSYAQKTFARNFKDIETTIQFSSDWNNGTGYLDGLVFEELGLEPGDMVKLITPNDRKVIIVGTRFGNCVYFERYSPEFKFVGDNNVETRSPVIVSNVPSKLRRFSPDGSLTENNLNELCGSIYNIGTSIERLFAL